MQDVFKKEYKSLIGRTQSPVVPLSSLLRDYFENEKEVYTADRR